MNKVLLIPLIVALMVALMSSSSSFASCYPAVTSETLELAKRYYLAQTKKLLAAHKITARSINASVSNPNRYSYEGTDAVWYYVDVTIITSSGNRLGLVGNHMKPGPMGSTDTLDFGFLLTVTSGRGFDREGASTGCSRAELNLAPSEYATLANLDTGRKVTNGGRFDFPIEFYFEPKTVTLP